MCGISVKWDENFTYVRKFAELARFLSEEKDRNGQESFHSILY